MISRGHRCRGLFSNCIGRAMFHSQPSRAGILHPHDNQVQCPGRHHARTKYPSSSQMKMVDSYHRNQSNHYFSTFTKSDYIHPLSQIVLEHLQSSHSNWVQRVGLDTGLKLNKDGTFILHFPSSGDDGGGGDIDTDDEASEGNSSEDKASTNGSIW